MPAFDHTALKLPPDCVFGAVNCASSNRFVPSSLIDRVNTL